VTSGRDYLQAHSATLRKSSARESQVVLELREGKNREVRRLFEAIGHQVTALKRVRLGALELGNLPPGQTRTLTRDEVRAAFPPAPV
jgi:pseudouridine synthase